MDSDAPIVVDSAWLAEHILDPNVVIVDVRPPYFFSQAHLAGAVNLPVFVLASQTGDPPPAEPLAAKLGDLGISRDTHIVAYDDGASPSAARLFWVLKYYRHPAVSILDGGITAWRNEGRDWEYVSVSPTRATYEIAQPDESVIARLDAVKASIGSRDVAILDVRTPAEYLGLERTAPRTGHIPGAINIDWTNNLIDDGAGIRRLRTDNELRALYEEAGVTPDKKVVLYCQTGNRVSETFMALKKLGYADVASYSAGWREWGSRDDTPVEEG